MKNKIKNVVKMITLCLLVVSASCQNELKIESTLSENSKQPFDMEVMKLLDVPEIEKFVLELTQNKTQKSNKYSSMSTNDISFNFDKILKVTDTVNHQNYSLRFTYNNTPQNVFYNLIVSKSSTGKIKAFVEKYNCNADRFEFYKNSQYDFQNFYGTVDLYDVRLFFNGTGSLARTIESEPCPPLYYPNGDPMPTATSFIYAGGTSSQSSGAGTTTGGSTNSGSTGTGGATWGAGISVIVTNTNPSTATTSTAGTCPQCGQVHRTAHTYPVRSRTTGSGNREATDPCPTDLTPAGFVGIASEPTNLQMLRIELQLSIEQWQFLHGKDELMAQLVQTIYSNPLRNTELEIIAHWAINFAMNNPPRNNSNVLALNHIINYPSNLNIDFVKQFVDNSLLSANLQLNFDDSIKSPANIDRTSISRLTPEGEKFNQIYDQLKNVPEYKAMIEDLFGGSQTRFNVKFEIHDHVYKQDNPTNAEVNGITIQQPNNSYLIKINK